MVAWVLLGDNSYPGFVAISSTEALMSWYSSHEGKASIYTARLNIDAVDIESGAAQE